MIHVLIERHIGADLESTYEAMARSTLQGAYQAVGFINGETFYDMNNPRHHYVLSKWRTLSDWQRWFQSDERRKMISQLGATLDGPEKITFLEN
ncbi:antibiotic biosynthesis monooxygenase [uncultured Pseudoteredinibacter sp.]|uniref:antibiotic biosynthesis monooxygenase family protein n=1 Tax=uncultured Pseudoteredinibacter sp. TaxID=1641701 RepID=UPI00263609D2|nr:antibiotic biosynthesis monooxygenase [uncultured Pseudoteredinibacter sp.]MCV6623986.1 antibiotic biosynthesis monooxygenase [Cellvibrionaceae bacterium]